MYRHPPPPSGRTARDLDDDTINETVLSAANLSGAPMGHSGAPIHGFYNPCDNMIWTQTGAYPQYMITPSYHMRQQPFEQQQQAFEQPHQPNFEQHTKVSYSNQYHWEFMHLAFYALLH